MLQEGTRIRKNGTLQPVQPEDIVILLRSPGTTAGYFQKALESRGIRCTTGAGGNLLKAEEICTLRSFLQVIMNPRLDIPLLIRTYNEKSISGKTWRVTGLDQTKGPEECLRCGACEDICPQHLKIRNLLEDVAATFEKKEEK